MLWFVYNVVFAIGYLLLLPKFGWRMLRRGGYRRGFLQRFALYSRETRERLRRQPRVWIHAVSVGETYVALRVMKEMRAAAPGTAFVLTMTTSTARALAEKEAHADDVLLYFPCDFPWIVRRALDAIRPAALLLVECELWPNLIRSAVRRGLPVVLVNGRISDASYRGYRKVRLLTRRILPRLRLLLAQTAADRVRLVELGARPECVQVVGTAKYDVTASEAAGCGAAASALAACGMGPGSLVLLGGSTWPGEEAALLCAYRALRESFGLLKLVLAPRHVERRGEVEAEIRRSGLRHVRRSELAAGPAPAAPEVLLVDTTGELRDFYACASVVFVGKSLTARGGQNIIEPAALGKAIVVGPHLENFAEVAADFREADALVQVADADDLTAALRRLLADEALCAEYGRRALAVVRAKRGALRRSVDLIRAAIRTPPP